MISIFYALIEFEMIFDWQHCLLDSIQLLHALYVGKQDWLLVLANRISKI